jgi:protein-disulfide isomerase
MKRIFSLLAAILFSTAVAHADILKPTGDDVILGDPAAPVQIIEYSSLSCPHCAHFHTNVMPTLKTKYIDDGRVSHITRFFPLNEPALKAAMVAKCAPKDKYYSFVSVFYELQDQWAFTTDFLEKITSIASVGGLSADSVSKCLMNSDLEKELLLSRKAAGEQLPIEGTPAFFINGVAYTGARSADAMSDAIDSALKGAAAR